MAKQTAEGLAELIATLTPREQREIERRIRGGGREIKTHVHKFSGNLVRFGYFSDSHIGAKEFDWELWQKMTAFFKQEGITTVYSPGDILEGMSGRDGQIYDLEAIGFQAQTKLAVRAFEMFRGCEVHFILGNHDLWFKSKGNAGVDVGAELEGKCSHVHCLGEWEADVVLGKGVTMKLYHANDGSA